MKNLFQAEIDYPARELCEKLVAGVDEMSRWNPTVIESRKLRVCGLR